MKRTTEEIEALVFNALGTGKEKALSRADLVAITQSNDRQVRAAIEALRHEKAILTLPGGNGYYLPPNTEEGRTEAVRWIVQQNKRIRSIREAQKGAREFAGGGNQQKAGKACKANSGTDQYVWRREMNQKIRQIADHYGYDAQSRQLVEEMAELTQAANKFWRKRVGRKLIPDHLSELLLMPEYSLLTSEIADVYLMLEQIRYLLQYSDKDLENDIMYKIDRTIARMKDD